MREVRAVLQIPDTPDEVDATNGPTAMRCRGTARE